MKFTGGNVIYRDQRFESDGEIMVVADNIKFERCTFLLGASGIVRTDKSKGGIEFFDCEIDGQGKAETGIFGPLTMRGGMVLGCKRSIHVFADATYEDVDLFSPVYGSDNISGAKIRQCRITVPDEYAMRFEGDEIDGLEISDCRIDAKAPIFMKYDTGRNVVIEDNRFKARKPARFFGFKPTFENNIMWNGSVARCGYG